MKAFNVSSKGSVGKLSFQVEKDSMFMCAFNNCTTHTGTGLDKRFFSKKNLLFSFINKRRFFSNKRRFSEFENYDDIMTQYDVIHLYK